MPQSSHEPGSESAGEPDLESVCNPVSECDVDTSLRADVRERLLGALASSSAMRSGRIQRHLGIIQLLETLKCEHAAAE